jgi:hypothetical protein
MSEILPATETLVDFITGKKIPNIGSEENRQAVERFLVESKGYGKDDIEVDVAIEVLAGGTPYRSAVDLAIRLDEGLYFMLIKCVAGSMGSWEREIIAASRLLKDYQIPYAVVSDGSGALILNTLTGKRIAKGMDAIPSRDKAVTEIRSIQLQPYPEDRLEREKIIFRSYDTMNVNVIRDNT